MLMLGFLYFFKDVKPEGWSPKGTFPSFGFEIIAHVLAPRMFLWCHCCPGTPQSLMTRMARVSGRNSWKSGIRWICYESLPSFPRWKPHKQIFWSFPLQTLGVQGSNFDMFSYFFQPKVGFQNPRVSMNLRLKNIAIQVVEPPWGYDKGFLVILEPKMSDTVDGNQKSGKLTSWWLVVEIPLIYRAWKTSQTYQPGSRDDLSQARLLKDPLCGWDWTATAVIMATILRHAVGPTWRGVTRVTCDRHHRHRVWCHTFLLSWGVLRLLVFEFYRVKLNDSDDMYVL